MREPHASRCFSVVEVNSTNTFIHDFSFLVAKSPKTSIKQRITLTVHNTNRPLRAKFYNFVGQPLSKQLYLNWGQSLSANCLLFCALLRYAGQSSKSVTLEAGKYYYVTGLQKGTESTDSLSAGVRLPSGRFMRPITKEILQWRMPGKKE